MATIQIERTKRVFNNGTMNEREPRVSVKVRHEDITAHAEGLLPLNTREKTDIVRFLGQQIANMLCNGYPVEIPHLGVLKLEVKAPYVSWPNRYMATAETVEGLRVKVLPCASFRKAMKDVEFEMLDTELKI